MTRIRSYGPSAVLAVLLAAVLFGAPHVVRQIAHAQQDFEIRQVRANLQNSPLGELSRAFRDVARAVEPSVVHISVSRQTPLEVPDGLPEGFPQSPEDLRRWFERRAPEPRNENQQQQEGQQYYQAPVPFGNGSGWVYPDGRHIITNNHVIRQADQIEVKFHDRTTARAEVIGRDAQTDIAVLRLTNNKQLHPAEISVEPIDRGDIVFAFGSPFGFEFSMSQGIVSGKGRQIGILGSMGYENFIQTDAAINQGNSGGPLTNYHGQVVGMNTAIATETGGNMGIGFAIPADMIIQVVDQLIARGEVTRGYLGVWIQDLDPQLARTFGYDGQGVLVEDLVGDDSPAGEGGIEGGDIITAIEGQPVRDASELRRRVAMIPPDQVINITVFREGEQVTFPVTLGEQPGNASAATPRRPQAQPDAPAPDQMEKLRELGIESVVTMTEQRAEQLGVDFTPGVLIERVRRGSVAFAAGLRPGVQILEVMNNPVADTDALTAELQQHNLSEGVRFRILINGVRRFVVLTLPDQ